MPFHGKSPMKTLLDTPRQGKRVLLTGGTGYLGSLLAAQMLRDGWAEHLVLPTRRPPATGSIPDEVRNELQALGDLPDRHGHRVASIHWQGAESATNESLRAMLEAHGVDTIVHCAGCLDYFDNEALTALNVDFTTRLVEAAKQARVQCFVFVSTAYSAGYSDASIPEAPLSTPERDPTRYTLTKRAAEHVVAQSGLPYLVVRPSIVIGDSTTGRYSGKRYGLYQQWMGVERLMSDRYHPELHTVATEQPVNLLHQDAFQTAMASILRWVPCGAHVNLVACGSAAPSMRDLWRMMCEVTRPQRVVFYDSLQQVDLKAIDIRQRSYLTFARTNIAIAAHVWRFERDWLHLLQQRGLEFVDISMATVKVCQDRFVGSSHPLQRYLEHFQSEFPAEVTYQNFDGNPMAFVTADHELA
ncbi:MAG: NAD-dependent epimerase/dehydratase family protein [Acidovorax sp.]|nr:MAG: NAD-dependent epimerase/dehydratase family protein [Acidovorax sp.]